MEDPLDFLFEAAYRSPHPSLANQTQSVKSGSRTHLTPFRDEPETAPNPSSRKSSDSHDRPQRKKKKKEKKKSVRIQPIIARSTAEELAFQLSGNQATGKSYREFTETLQHLSDSGPRDSEIGFSSIKRNQLKEALEYSKQQERSTVRSETAPVGPVSFSYTTIGFNNNLSNLPEWTCLRDNYIRQLHSLESHESIACQKGYKTEISIPNFISLLLSLRKISCRIAYAFQVAVQSKSVHDISFSDLHGYVLRMVNDLTCINRSPFIDWLGIITVYNPFLSCRKLDGTSALVCLERKPSIGVQVHRVIENGITDDLTVSLNIDTLEMRNELRMTESEQEFVDSLSETLWGTYLQHQEATKYRRPGPDNQTQSENIGTECASHELAADMGYQNLLLNSQQFPTHSRIKQVYWKQWRRRYTIKVGLRNIKQGREHCILRKFMDAWVHFVWQNIQFRKLQRKRWIQLLTMTFQGWLQYLFWCRRFNHVLQRAIRENQRRVLLRMHLFAKQEHQNRSFKRMRALMPLKITFRALRENALINKFRVARKLIHGTQHVFSDQQLRQYCFQRWKEYVRIGMALETIDVSLLVAKLRQVFRDWKILTWPERYGKESTTSRLLRTMTSGFVSNFQDNANKSFRVLNAQREKDNNSENGDIKSQISFDSKASNQLSWLAFALRNG